MIYFREQRYGDLDTSSNKGIEGEPLKENNQSIDLESMPFFTLRAYAVERGIDVEVFRTKKDILAQLAR